MKIQYNNLYTHFVFTTFDRQRLITEENRVRIEKYITGIVSKQKSKLYAINANPEHMHMLISRNPGISDEELATIVANSSERFVNEYKLTPIRFHWQQSASAFSVSKSDIERVCKYILSQPEHHKKVSFTEEYEKFIKYYEDTLKK
jgi:REP element-mobilizing transposase RayT